MMKKKRAILVLLCALAMPLPASAAIDDIFSVMFRMMLVMMNVMSDAMLGNNMSNGFGQSSNFGMGMGSFPMMAGMSTMNPMSGVSGFPGMSPWSGMSPMSGMGGFPGMSPWGGVPGMSPWSGMGSHPGSGYGSSPWSTPAMGDNWANPYAGGPYNTSGYNGPSGFASLLEGRWFGQSGEMLEVNGDRFRLHQGRYGTSGTIRIENNIVNLYSQDSGTVTQYTFVRNQSDLVLQDATGQVSSFSRRPVNRTVHVF